MEALHTLLVGQRAAYGADTADMYLRLLHCVFRLFALSYQNNFIK